MLDGAAAFGRTVPELLAWWASATPEGVAFQFRAAVDDRWQPITWAEHQVAMGRMARGLAGRGLHPGARVGILAPTSIRWEIRNLHWGAPGRSGRGPRRDSGGSRRDQPSPASRVPAFRAPGSGGSIWHTGRGCQGQRVRGQRVRVGPDRPAPGELPGRTP